MIANKGKYSRIQGLGKQTITRFSLKRETETSHPLAGSGVNG